MEASDGCLCSTKFGEDPSHSLSLFADENLVWWGSGVESGVGGGVGLPERVIFFFQQGERRTVMCAELMTKGPFMCSVCR